MVNKKIVSVIFMAIIFAILSSVCLKKTSMTESESLKEPAQKCEIKKTQQVIKPIEKKYDLYSSVSQDLPLFSVVEISKLSPIVKKSVDQLLELSQGFYFLRFNDDSVFVILQNPVSNSNTYQRHDLQFAQIDMEGKIQYHTAGYSGIENETLFSEDQITDDWTFSEQDELKRPLKHIAYDEKGKTKFIEIWNYDNKDSVKYQMKDAKKNVLSILKETQDNESNLRREHVFYDNNGKIVMSLIANYDGANISRLNFYNSHDLVESISVFSHYEDGLKTKEMIYDEEYKLIYTTVAEYKDGERIKITVYNNEGEEISSISS